MAQPQIMLPLQLVNLEYLDPLVTVARQAVLVRQVFLEILVHLVPCLIFLHGCLSCLSPREARRAHSLILSAIYKPKLVQLVPEAQ